MEIGWATRAEEETQVTILPGYLGCSVIARVKVRIAVDVILYYIDAYSIQSTLNDNDIPRNRAQVSLYRGVIFLI